MGKRIGSLVAAVLWAAATLGPAEPAVAVTPQVYAPGSVRQALRLADGSLIVAGNFTSVAETGRAGLAKIDANGQLDATWNPSGLAVNTALQVVALAASPAGDRLYIATPDAVQAVSTSGAGSNVPGFALNASGSVDGGNSGIRALAVDGGGNLYIGGAFAYIDGQARNGLARVDAGGTLDTGWKPAANSTIATLAIDSGAGFVYAGGAFVNLGGGVHLRLGRVLISDGSVDATWAPTVSSTSDGVHRITLSAAGDALILSGNFTAVNSLVHSGIAEVSTATGATDTAWNPDVTGGSVDAIVAASDYVYLGGDLFCCASATLARVAATGTGAIDAGWSPSADNVVRALLPDAGGAVLAFGDFSHMGDTPVLSAAQLQPTGAATHALPDVEREGSIIASFTEPTGSALLAGDFEKVDHAYRGNLLRLQANATVDADFVPPRFEGGSGYRVVAVAADPASGDVYVGGTFAKAGGSVHGLVARLEPATGAVDDSWAPTIDASPGTGIVQALAVGTDGVFVGGQFTHVNNAAHANIAKLDFAGAVDPLFAGATNGAVSRLALGGNGVYIGGTFLTPRARIARLHAGDGSYDPAWNPAFPWVVTWLDFFDLKRAGKSTIVSNQISVSALGGVVVVGELVQIADSGTATVLARFDQPVFDVLPAADAGSVYAAGTFSVQYAIDDFFAQTPHPGGLAQVSLRGGTLGMAEAWSPAVPLAGGVPGLVALGDGLAGAVIGRVTPSYPFARTGLDLLALPLGDFVFRDGFE